MRTLGQLSAVIVSASFVAAAAAQAAPAIPSNAFVSAAVPTQVVSFSVYIPVRNQPALDALAAAQQTLGSPSYHKWLTPAQFNTQFGPTQASITNVTGALQAQGFTVAGVTGRAVHATGTASMVAHAFSTTLSAVTPRAGVTQLVAQTALTLPATLKAEGAIIPSFTGLARQHTNVQAKTVALASPNNRYSSSGGYWYDDLKQAYDYPSYQSFDGTGANVAILISNDALDSDIAAMFTHEKFTTITGKAPPTLTHIMVDGGAPFDVNASFEASLDVQQVFGGAPGASVSIVDVPNLDDDVIMDGYNYIVNNNAPNGKPYELVNSSFGGCELFYTAPYNGGADFTYILAQENAIFEQGNVEGITFVASSGDSGGLECPDTNYFAASAASAPSRFLPGVEFPASSPYVTAVGGTNLITTYNPPTLNSAYVMENGLGDPELPYDPYGVGVNVNGGFWGAGGGASAVFTQPSYQALVNTGSSFRTTPDIGMQVGGCPGGISITPCGPNRSYVIIYDGGGEYGVIGTSVSSPEFVGALALYVQKVGGGLGNINTFLYTQGAHQTSGAGTYYNRYIPGFDGKYTNTTPSANYNYIVGNGTPQIRSLFGMTGVPAAGLPQTPSNP